MSAGLPFNIKDQSGVSLSERWLRERGQAMYGARTTGRTLENRTTRPITKEWYEAVVAGGACLSCGGPLQKTGNPNGGTFMACKDKTWTCYHLGWRESEGSGEERIL